MLGFNNGQCCVLCDDNNIQFFGYTTRRAKLRDIDAEIDLMLSLRGIEGMVQMEGVFMDTLDGCIPGKTMMTPFPVIIMELLEGGELFERIADRQTFSENNIAKIFKGIVLAMDSMHKRRFIHRKCGILKAICVSCPRSSFIIAAIFNDHFVM